MRVKISLFELLLLVVPAISVALALLMSVVQSREPLYALTIAQGVLLVAMLAAICALFHRHLGTRVFAGAFLAAALGHLLLVWLASQSPMMRSFPTSALLGMTWDYVRPDQSLAATNANYFDAASGWTSYPSFSPTGSVLPSGYIATPPAVSLWPGYSARQVFIDVGVWMISLLLGIACGLVAKSLRGSDDKPS